MKTETRSSTETRFDIIDRSDASKSERFNEAVEARARLVIIARQWLGEDFKQEGLSDRQIREAVLKNRMQGIDLAAKSDDYLIGAMSCLDPDSVDPKSAKKADAENANAATERARLDRAAPSEAPAWTKPLAHSKERNTAPAGTRSDADATQPLALTRDDVIGRTEKRSRLRIDDADDRPEWDRPLKHTKADHAGPHNREGL